MRERRKNHWEISSTIRRELHKLSISLWEKKVSRLTLLNVPTSLWKLLSGKSSMHTWRHTRICKDKIWKNKWKIRKIKSQFKFNKSKLRILCTVLPWREPSKSWNAWLFKMLMMRSLKITNTMKIQLNSKTQNKRAVYFHYGASPLSVQERSMLPQFVGTHATRICLLSVMVHMIS